MTDVLIDTAYYCVKTIPVIIAGIVLINIIELRGWIDKLSFLARPVTRFGRLHNGCGISFITAFGSPSAANSMLMQLYTDKKIAKKELFIAVITNSFPTILMHWRSMLPVIIPLMGMVGLAYFTILISAGLIKTILVLIVGRIILKNTERESDIEQNLNREIINGWNLIKSAFLKSWKLIRRIIYVTIPTTFVVFLLIELGVFDWLTENMKGITTYFPIPPEGVGIVAAYFGNSLAAYTISGNLLSAHAMSGKFVIISLLVAQVLGAVINVFRYSAPYYIGIFGTKLGIQLMLLSTGLRVLVILSMIYLIHLFA